MHRTFYFQVISLIATAMIAYMMLLRITNVSFPFLVGTSILVASAAIGSNYFMLKALKKSASLAKAKKTDYAAVSLGLSIAHAIFVFPLFVCILAP